MRLISTERVLELVVSLGAFATQFVEKDLGLGGAGRRCGDLFRVSLGENELGAKVGDMVGRVDRVYQKPSRLDQHTSFDGL